MCIVIPRACGTGTTPIVTAASSRWRAHPARRRRVHVVVACRHRQPGCFAAGPYRVPNTVIDGYAVRTNNPPCGAMRGFGAVQNCFAHEAQMDKLAAALGLEPVELRLRNALGPGRHARDRTGDPGHRAGRRSDPGVRRRTSAGRPRRRRRLPRPPGGAGRTAGPGDVQRGVGFAVGFKNLLFSEGFDDYSTARVRVENGVVTVHSACAEVGQGFVTLAQQIAARCSASTRSCWLRPTPRSGRPDRPRPAGSRGCPVAPSSVRAATCSPKCSPASRATRASTRRRSRWSTTASSRPTAPRRLDPRRRCRQRVRGDARVPPRPDAASRHRRSRQRARLLRVRRASRSRRRRCRARSDPGRRDRHRTGRRSCPQPAASRRADRRRHRPGCRPRSDGGDGDRRRE